MAKGPTLQSSDDHQSRITKEIRRKRYRRALELVARAHAAQIGRLCFAMVGNQAEAEELTQEILIAAFRAMPGFEGRASVKTWLYTIARRICGKALRKQQRRGVLIAAMDELEQVPERWPEQQVEALRQRLQLREAMGQLPSNQVEVLFLRYAGGLSYREVAEVCGIREEAARQRASSGLRRLRQDLTSRRRVNDEDNVRRQVAAACQELPS